MSLIQKYIWVIKTIHRFGRITLKDLNEKWRENIDLSRGARTCHGRPLIVGKGVFLICSAF